MALGPQTANIGNGLQSNSLSSQDAIWQFLCHFGPYACCRNRTQTTAKCFGPLHLETRRKSDLNNPGFGSRERITRAIFEAS